MLKLAHDCVMLAGPYILELLLNHLQDGGSRERAQRRGLRERSERPQARGAESGCNLIGCAGWGEDRRVERGAPGKEGGAAARHGAAQLKAPS